MKNLLVLILLSAPLILLSQNKTIRLSNASFEGNPQDATTPAGWHPCELGTTPDILPGFWNVYTEASEGETFIGLITRDDGSFESIGQRISVPLKKEECFNFSIDLARSKTYELYNQPIKLRVWAGNSKCDRSQLILETNRIEHSDWKTYQIRFTSKSEINYLIIEAYDKEGRYTKKGNILIDNISVIKTCVRA